MHGSFKTEKISPAAHSYGECAEDTRHHWRKPKNYKPRNKGKSAYSSARKLKESQYVWSE